MTAAPRSADVTSTIPWAKMPHGWLWPSCRGWGEQSPVRMDLLQVREGKCRRTEWGARPSDACCWLGLPDAQAAPAPVWLA